MRSEPIKLNGIELSAFGAEAIGLEISAHKFSNLFLGLTNIMRPIKLNEKKSYRTITLELEFFGDDEYDVAEKQSNFTQYLLDHEIELDLPDGFAYTSTIASVGNIKREAEFIYTSKYKFAGFRHKDKVEIDSVSSGDEIEVQGNDFAEAVFTVTGNGTNILNHIYRDRYGNQVTESYTLECSNVPIIIDGIKKTVTRNGINVFKDKATFGKFPALKAGTNTFTFVLDENQGSMSLSVEYYPTFA